MQAINRGELIVAEKASCPDAISPYLAHGALADMAESLCLQACNFHWR